MGALYKQNGASIQYPELTGVDVDAYWEDADAVGDEAVGSTAPTPDQNVTEELEAAVGLEMDDRCFRRASLREAKPTPIQFSLH